MNLTPEKIKLMGCKYQKPSKKSLTRIDYNKGFAIPKGIKNASEDMTGLNIPKEKRISDSDKFEAEVKKPFCEYCGSRTDEYPHHVETRGSGGPDVKRNGIQLCKVCHDKAHRGKIKKRVLFEIIARREREDVEDIIENVKQLCV